MKKTVLLLFTLLLITACNQENKKPEQTTQIKVEKKDKAKNWVLDADNSSVHWTGFKTTEKTAVSGVFKAFEITSVAPNPDLLKTIKTARIRINVYSIFSDKESRDKILVEYLFGKMMETNNINARIESIDPDKKIIQLNINMNNHEKIIPMDYKLDTENGSITMEGKIDLVKDFDAGEPLYFLHTACKDKHTGKDGVSKTWSEVGIKAILKFNKS